MNNCMLCNEQTQSLYSSNVLLLRYGCNNHQELGTIYFEENVYKPTMYFRLFINSSEYLFVYYIDDEKYTIHNGGDNYYFQNYILTEEITIQQLQELLTDINSLKDKIIKHLLLQ